MLYKTILIDDEPLAISRLNRLLGQYPEVFDCIDTATNGQEGLEKIERLKPDLIFLDIEMPLLNGFEMLENLAFKPRVIFCTAYDQYAIQAFEENSIDYLLKPVEKERLAKTVEKLKGLGKPQDHQLNNQMLQELLAQIKPKEELHSLAVKQGEKILFVKLNEVCFFHAEDKYVFLNTQEGKQYLTNHTITSLAEKLPDIFVQISRSAIVNKTCISSLEKGFKGKFHLQMTDAKHSQLESGSSFGQNLKDLVEW
ncbi:LytTR family DNA-binding domain-containing protein [Marinilongibacter aquaticus]|uniref:LytR/AlgR family response regulator transcription factor n=1 Tax=Marinilongibacter aquaticus TaxID=2975157 RepID=UPI0021BDBCA2|nr:LytTR family DNA-binding domain-containing protein [Marinilongibacter aquaticus]UBM57203.1 LytTR family DNA-binding domain-containing protein [Marinilongibacter aquaticus]